MSVSCLGLPRWLGHRRLLLAYDQPPGMQGNLNSLHGANRPRATMLSTGRLFKIGSIEKPQKSEMRAKLASDFDGSPRVLVC